MLNRFLVACATLTAVGSTVLGVAPTAQARTQAPIPPAARGSITFDVATGQVISSYDDRTPLRVASTIKLLTALVVRANVHMSSTVTITDRAEAVPPLKLTMAPGTQWRANDLLHAMLIASLNDAATALAIKAGGGSLDGYQKALAAEARRLGLADHPLLHDPAGLDGEESVDGGNLISARDLAIVTRTFLADPLLAGIVQLRSYRFEGGDGKPHVVFGHNAFLSIYPGAIGVKTGYTERSGHSLVAAATRNGRTFATIVIGSSDPVGYAKAALDAAFASAGTPQGTSDVLPPVGVAPSNLAGKEATRKPVIYHAVVAPTSSSFPYLPIAAGVIVVLGLVLATIRLRGAD